MSSFSSYTTAVTTAYRCEDYEIPVYLDHNFCNVPGEFQEDLRCKFQKCPVYWSMIITGL